MMGNVGKRAAHGEGCKTARADFQFVSQAANHVGQPVLNPGGGDSGSGKHVCTTTHSKELHGPIPQLQT